MACCDSRILWRIIAIFSMAVSCFMIGLSICGLLTYHCAFNPGVSKFNMNNFYLTYVLYFYNNDCRDLETNFIVFDPFPSERTWAIMIAYITISTLWFITSVMLLFAPNYWKTKTVSLLTYPWLLATLAVLCLDLASTIIYALDLNDIWDLEKLFNFIKISYPGYEEDSRYFTYVPAGTIIMASLCSKFFIGWFLLLICCITIFVVFIRSRKPEHLILQTRSNVDFYAPPAYANPAFEMREGDDVAQRREGALWEPKQYRFLPMMLPRARLDQRSNGWTEPRNERSSSPKGILKETTAYPTNRQKPWSYLPEVRNQQSYVEENQNNFRHVQQSAPLQYERNSNAMYF